MIKIVHIPFLGSVVGSLSYSISTVIMMMSLASCSGGTSNISVTISTSPYYLIPAKASSCMGKKANLPVGNPAPEDISSSYFRVPSIKFTRIDSSKDLIISLIRIKTVDGATGTQVSCDISGDSLLALSDTWWPSAQAAPVFSEAKISSGTTTFTTDCALYCGGFSTDSSYTTSGSLEIIGLERDSSTQEETPVRTSTGITLQAL